MAKKSKKYKQQLVVPYELVSDLIEQKNAGSDLKPVEWGNEELKKLIADDNVRLEIQASMNRVFEEVCNGKIDSLTKEYQYALSKHNKIVQKYEHKLHDVNYELRMERKTVKELAKSIKSLEEEVKSLKHITKYMGTCVGVATAGASLKEVRRGFKKRADACYRIYPNAPKAIGMKDDAYRYEPNIIDV